MGVGWYAVGAGSRPGLGWCGSGGRALSRPRLGLKDAFGAVDRHVYYDTSSYGPRAVDAVVRVVGVDPLVHGSDRPYADPRDPGLGEAFTQALFVTNPHHLLNGGTR